MENFLLLLSSNLWSGTFFFFFLFSSEGKVYGKLGFWLKACRTTGHDICQDVGLASGPGKKAMSHITSMIQMQHWWLGNFMQNWSCMHPCGHSSIKFLWSCDIRAQDLFFPILVNLVFPKHVLLSIHTFIRVHFERSGKFSQHSPFRCIHIFQQKNPSFWSVKFFCSKKSWKLFSFQKHVGFLANQFNFYLFFIN